MNCCFVFEGLLVQGPAQSLVAQLGGSIILPCSVETPLPVGELEVEWMKTDEEELVHLFQNGEVRPEAQYPSYSDRAHFFPEQIFKGNFSILLENITVRDTGRTKAVIAMVEDLDINMGRGSPVIRTTWKLMQILLTLLWLCN